MQSSWQNLIGLGVAGNFASHLEQARQASNFKDLEIADAAALNGVSPFYVPGGVLDDDHIASGDVADGSSLLRPPVV